ncbi:interferon regulatory factor 9 [Polyodon spathula]|uniref:interferon regulatory factor 9 n=1 Tax=Polyodon spathula TaxID=7913 RepID=UPI001B7F3FFE|nr:interferon regulatory factor 9 [Polyodon spathula]
MATRRIRSTRKLKQWIVDQVSSEKYAGLVWDDPNKTMFRIPWKHAGKQDFRSDEDAAIFRAWAVYKGKLKPGEMEQPATWKTRLRCALNKSSEFEEVPGRSQLDISEPYKVYRIVPVSEQSKTPAHGPRDSGERGMKRRRVKSEPQSGWEEEEEEEEEVEEEERRRRKRGGGGEEEKKTESPAVVVQPVILQVESVMGDSNFEKQTSQSVAAPYKTQQHSPLNEIQLNFTIETTPPSTALPSMLITIFYAGLEVSQRQIMGKDVKISSRPPGCPLSCPPSSMERVWLPPADSLSNPAQSQALASLLPFLERGVMLACTPSGLFIHRLCQGRVFWSGPGAPHHDRPNKLDRQEELVQLFDKKRFSQELTVYLRRQT